MVNSSHLTLVFLLTFLFSECNAGYYERASMSCTLCPGSTIKSQKDDTTDCTDPPCNRMSFIPNPGHTACGSRHDLGFETESFD